MKKKRQILICFLVALAIISQNLVSYAFQDKEAVNGETNTVSVTEESVRENTSANMVNTGQVNVLIGPAISLEKSVEFTVELSGQNPQKITLAAEGEAQKGKTEAVFEGLAPGNYTLTVTAEGFAAYSQELTVGKQACTVKLMTGFVNGLIYEEAGLHPGVLLIGDVNGDRAVDDKDSSKLIQAIDNSDSTSACDLTGDGSVDLADLEYMTKGYLVTEDTKSKVETAISSAIIQAEVLSGTAVVEGSKENLFKNEGSVTLMPENEAEITDEHPVCLEFKLNTGGEAALADGMLVRTGGDNPIDKAVIDITYEDSNGQEYTQTVPVQSNVSYLLNSSDVHVERDVHGNLQIYFGEQVAIKKVTLTIMGMQKNNNLAEISSVSFVNGMEELIPEPQMDIPNNLTAKAGNKQFTLSWDPCVNVTAYEVLIMHGDRQETRRTAGNSLTVTSFEEEELVNNTEYTVAVQAVNGTWRSGYCQQINVIPKPDKKPDKPDNVRAEGKYKGISISWKMMEDTDSYNLYYKESSAGEYQKIENITSNNYIISDLKDKAEYTLYVTGVNELGESEPSLTVKTQTVDIDPAQMPKYKLINTKDTNGKGAHIVNITQQNGEMRESVLDTEERTAWGVVDHNPVSYYIKNSWDDGGFNALGSNGLTVEFDQEYTMQEIALTEIEKQTYGLFYAKVAYWDAQGNKVELDRMMLTTKQDSENRPYYLLRLPKAITAKKIQIGLARYLAAGTVTVSEMYFYHYDSIEDDIMALYSDDLHTVLKDEVTQKTIDALRERINTKDEVSKEYHPNKEMLEKELKNAEEILQNKNLCAPVLIYNSISTYDVNRGFGGLNAWQPLGINAAAGDEIVIYVGHNTLKTGANTNLQLVATQYHAESSPMFTVASSLKVGRNTITIPKIWSVDKESGGALYIQYTGNNADDRYAVRVDGGTKVPVLDLYKVTDENERYERVKAYLEELNAYSANIEALHNEQHAGSKNSLINRYDYEEKNCIAGGSDILLDTMLMSLPAKQIINGAGSGTIDEQTKKVLKSLDAMEEMMYLFYQHKGLNNNAPNAKDQFPKGHLNIRYQRMFAGAFMYASGNHIGIEWNETAGMVRSESVESDSEGRYLSGNYFGWGIAHEIGHCINQGAYAIAEITNNYFAQLAQAKDSNSSIRFSYNNIYEKVTSGTKGRSSNVFTQLGLYWQLHLAYDNSFNYKTYDSYDEQLGGLFFARVDTYARDTSKAPSNGVALQLSGDKDQDLIRLSCAAAQKNLLDFFERWGMTPNAETIAYAEQFEKETRAIYYACDDAKAYRLENSGSSLGTEGTIEAVGDDVTAEIDASNASRVNFTFSSKNIAKEDVLGYEIVRVTISGGEEERETVGFTTENSYSDYITTLNNRVVTYEITLIDKYLNRSAVKILPSLKIEHDGSIDKTFFSVSASGMTDLTTTDTGTGTDDDPCEPRPEEPIKLTIDQNVNTIYEGLAGENAQVLLQFNKPIVVSGFKYTSGAENPIGDYAFYVRSGEEEWIKAAEGTLGGSKTIYFTNEDNKYISTYNATEAKLVINGKADSKISIAELDMLGVTGDNVDFRSADDGTVAIGRLTSDYMYGTGAGDVIPKGSIVFTGSYKGNPAYNVVILYDQNGNIVGKTKEDGSLNADQIILADVPDSGKLDDVSDGVWIYWIEPEKSDSLSGISKVRAELYRVNNALTNEGQRLVSDSLFKDIPETLPDITFRGNAGEQE